MGEIVAPAALTPAQATGTLFDPGRNCHAATRAARAAFLVDAENYYRAFMRAAARATHSIIIIGWDFDSRTRLSWEEAKGDAPPALLGDFLNFLVSRRRELNVYILDWDYPMVFGANREMRPLYGLGWSPRRRVHLHYDKTHPVGASHHQKIVVIDDALAFSGGLDLTCRRWDTRAHVPGDARRTLEGEPYSPLHDAMVAVDGNAAQVLAQIARDRWMLATREAIPPVRGANDPWPVSLEPDMTDVDVAVSRTVPGSDTTQDVREVEALYLDMIAAARHYIYVENQYFTSERIGAALAARLAAPRAPEIVLVTRRPSHGWLEEHTIDVLRTRLVRRLRAADTQHRFEAYCPFVRGLEEGSCIDCQSKVMIIDDEWLRIGSANLSNRSMALDTECDLTFEARGKVRLADATRDFRDRLLGEHVGRSIDEIRETLERAGSLNAALRAWQSDERTLRVLEDVPQPLDAELDPASVADPERTVSLERLIDEFAPDTHDHGSGPAWGRIAALALGVGVLALLWRHTPLSGLLAAERIVEWAHGVGDLWWAPLAVIAAYTPACFVMFPRPLITLFAVIAFGPVAGLAYSLAGIVGAALATYFAGSALPRDTVRRLAGDKLNEMTDVLRRRGLIAIFAVRIVPVAPFAIEGMVAGAVNIKLWHYTLGTVLGMLPGTLTTIVFGDQIQTALVDPSQINHVLVAGVVVFFAIVILIVRRWFVRQHRPGNPSA